MSLPSEPTSPSPSGEPPRGGASGLTRRRAVLTGVAAIAGGGALIAGVSAGRRVTGQAPEPAQNAVTLPKPVTTDPLPEGVEAGVDGVTPFRVPNDDFFQIDTAFGLPKVDVNTWQLRIHGMVEREVVIDYPTILAGELIERDIALSCVSNSVGGDLLGNALWLGLPIAPLLAQAGPAAEADMVLSTSADDWTASTPLAALTDDRGSMLAVGMNGEVLPQRHGYPVRMIVPGLFGFVSATKWVVSLEVTRFDLKSAYWTKRGWSPKGPIKLSSRIDVPGDGAKLSAGEVRLGGVAWGPNTGIAGVEVRVDGGPWQPAQLAADAGVEAWRQWSYTWQASAGRHELQVRSTDGQGQVQTGDRADVIPDGASGWHTVEVTVA